ncbi:AAA family ATPase [Parasedimentitalea huanghaiensis]|uniref:AAA family ATPase n=1 Tax=Parasedimentitalea huanghaiensis TaxID=2682100 RepID=UPI0031594751
MVNKFILTSGCSGGGKSSVLSELGSKGYKTVEEPGRRIVKEELAKGGRMLPWFEAVAFAHRAIDMARADLALMSEPSGFTFFDRGLVDAAIALESCSGLTAKRNAGKCSAVQPSSFSRSSMARNLCVRCRTSAWV